MLSLTKINQSIYLSIRDSALEGVQLGRIALYLLLIKDVLGRVSMCVHLVPFLTAACQI